MYPFMQQTAFFSSMKWQVTCGNCRSRLGAGKLDSLEGGGLARRFKLWLTAASGPLMCCLWWELKTEKHSKVSPPLCSFFGDLPLASLTWAALFTSGLTGGFMPSAPQAATSAVVGQVKWEQVLEEGLKGSDTPEIHFKQTIRACWNMGLIGFYEYTWRQYCFWDDHYMQGGANESPVRFSGDV